MSLLYANVKWSIDESSAQEKENDDHSVSLLHSNIQKHLKSRPLQTSSTLKCTYPYSLIEYICLRYDGNLIHVKTINEHYFTPQIKYLLTQKHLFNHKSSHLANIFFLTNSSVVDFKLLCDNLNSLYENPKLVVTSLNKANTKNSLNLSFGAQDIDERIFLTEAKFSQKQFHPSKRHHLIREDSQRNLIIITVPTMGLELLLDLAAEKKKANESSLNELLESFKNESDFLSEEHLEFLKEFLVKNCLNSIKEKIVSEIEMVRIL